MNDLKGKVAVVTGASKGIGAAIAKSLSAAGAAVVVNYSSGREGADRVVADIKANGGEAIAVKGDVAKAADVQRLFGETEEAFHALDVLVNNAGVYKFQPLEEITEDEFHREFDINVLGTILATKEAVKHFGPNGGSIINISSIASAGEAQAAIYSGTKGAVDAITRALAAEVHEKYASTPLRRALLTPKGRAVAALWAATLRRKRSQVRRFDASDNLTTSPASQFSSPPRIPRGLRESG